MAYLHLNGYQVLTSQGHQVNYTDTFGRRGYGPSGNFQFGRNHLGRAWRFTSIPLPQDEAAALVGMLTTQGDSWRWDLDGDPEGVHYLTSAVEAETYSDKRRASQSADTKATVISAYGADGARVYDWNGNTMAPFSSSGGVLAVDVTATNLLTSTEAHPTANGHLTNVSSGTHAADSVRYWTGSGAVSVNCTATNDGVEVDATTVISSVYALSAHVRGHVGGEAISVEYVIGGGTVIATENYTLPSDPDTWTRVKVTGTQITNTTTRLRVSSNGGAMDFAIDGLQIELQSSQHPTAWVDPGADPWGSGNGIRPAGLLNFDQWTTDFTKGFTFAMWFNPQTLGASSDGIPMISNIVNPRSFFIWKTSDRLDAFVRAVDGSDLQAISSSLAVGWHMGVFTYDPTGTPTLSLYVDGALEATDTTWSGDRQSFDATAQASDFCIGTGGNAGVFTFQGVLGPMFALPYVAPLATITGWYNSGADSALSPGVMPMAATGDFLPAGCEGVKVYSQVNSTTNVPFRDPTNGWESGGTVVDFTLFETPAR